MGFEFTIFFKTVFLCLIIISPLVVEVMACFLFLSLSITLFRGSGWRPGTWVLWSVGPPEPAARLDLDGNHQISVCVFVW